MVKASKQRDRQYAKAIMSSVPFSLDADSRLQSLQQDQPDSFDNLLQVYRRCVYVNPVIPSLYHIAVEVSVLQYR